jgi:hypothetical protein
MKPQRQHHAGAGGIAGQRGVYTVGGGLALA